MNSFRIPGVRIEDDFDEDVSVVNIRRLLIEKVSWNVYRFSSIVYGHGLKTRDNRTPDRKLHSDRFGNCL